MCERLRCEVALVAAHWAPVLRPLKEPGTLKPNEVASLMALTYKGLDMRTWYVAGSLSILALSIGFYLSKPTSPDVRAHEIDELRAAVVQLRADLTRTMDELHPKVEQLREYVTAEKTQRERAFAHLEASIRSSEAGRASNGIMRVGAAATNKRANPVEERAQAGVPNAGEQTVNNPADLKEFMETTFAGQSVDPSWAPAAEDTLQYGLGDQLPSGSVIQSVECHTSICRIETVHNNSEDYEQFLTTFKDPNNRIWSGDASSQELTQGPHGDRVVVTYFSREGEPLATTSR